jgi:hypothetical protein
MWLKVDRSFPPNTEVKNEWSYTSNSPIRLRDADRDNLSNFLIFLILFKFEEFGKNFKYLSIYFFLI